MFFYTIRHFGIRRLPRIYRTQQKEIKKRQSKELWGKELYRGKYGNSIYGAEDYRKFVVKQDKSSLWWVP